jgi:hypothetical protein
MKKTYSPPTSRNVVLAVRHKLLIASGSYQLRDYNDGGTRTIGSDED